MPYIFCTLYVIDSIEEFCKLYDYYFINILTFDVSYSIVILCYCIFFFFWLRKNHNSVNQ